MSPLGKSLAGAVLRPRSEEHTSELQSLAYLECRLLLEKKKPALAVRERVSPGVPQLVRAVPARRARSLAVAGIAADRGPSRTSRPEWIARRVRAVRGAA